MEGDTVAPNEGRVSNGDVAPPSDIGFAAPKAVDEPKPLTRDLEAPAAPKKYPYPKSVFFIVINEFCERFSYYGQRAVLTLYLKNILNFSENTATTIYHAFTAFVYFTPLFGAMLADSLLGKFKTIFILSIVYACGNLVLAAAATPDLKLPATAFSMMGLALIAIGTGGIKPCVSAFGGDQFHVPEQNKQLTQFFSLFYFAINGGSLVSTLITPIFRKDISCFGEETCYALAFAVPAGLFIVAIIVFVLGRPLYIVKEPTGNIVLKVVKAIVHALGRKGKNKKAGVTKTHWLDNADDKYEQRFLDDIKIVLRVLVLYIPLPVFWSLFDQTGSRWTFQATRMNGVIGGFTVKPDQVQVINPALILIFIPIFEKGFYPLFAKCNLLKNPLQRIVIGGILAGISFGIAGIVEMQLEDTYPINLKTGESILNIINTLPCEFKVEGHLGSGILPPGGTIKWDRIDVKDDKGYHLEFTPSQSEDQFCNDFSMLPADNVTTRNMQQYSYILGQGDDHPSGLTLFRPWQEDDIEKSGEGNPKLKIVMDPHAYKEFDQPYFHVYDEKMDDDVEFYLERIYDETNDEDNWDQYLYENWYIPDDEDDHLHSEEMEPKEFTVKMMYTKDGKNVSETLLTNFDLKLGGGYTFYVYRDPKNQDKAILGVFEVMAPNSIHMAWLFPQYIVLTLGEVMFSITGLEFSYSQSPVSMKSVMQSAWLLTVAFGNIIVIIIAEAQFFEEQSKEFFLFAGIMIVDMFVFAFMAYRYVPAVLEDAKKEEEDDKQK